MPSGYIVIFYNRSERRRCVSSVLESAEERWPMILRTSADSTVADDVFFPPGSEGQLGVGEWREVTSVNRVSWSAWFVPISRSQTLQ